jgi:putative ABC transport system permease protein
VGFGRVNGSTSAQQFTLIDPHTMGNLFDLQFTQGSLDALTDDGILISKSESEKGHPMGSAYTVEFIDQKPHTLTVQGIYGKDQLAGKYVVTKDLYASSGADVLDFAVYVQKKPGADSAETEAAIKSVVAKYPNGTVQSRSEYIDSQAAQIDTLVNLIYVLLALAVLIAALGITNTLSLSVYERTRELGLVRAVGAERRQVRSTVRWEAVITALLGTVQGIVVGILLGYAVVLAVRSQGLKKFTIPGGSLIVVIIIALVLGVLAAIPPAVRASRLDVLKAIATE